ncbi:MAG: DUF4159 domain-containing protein, partial [Thermoguttaceae bacterium]
YCPPMKKNARRQASELTSNDDRNNSNRNDTTNGAVYRTVADQRPKSVSQFRPSLSCLWEIAKLVDRGDPYAQSVQEQIDAGLAIGCNVLAYATNRELLNKLDRSDEVRKRQESEIKLERGMISVGMIQHGGGASCAPRAIPRLMEAAALKYGSPVSTKVEKIRLSDSQLAKFPILFMHGRNAFTFSEEERKALKNYIERGGFVFVNSICASSAFTKSFEEEINKIFPDSPMMPIPLDDPLYSDAYSGTKIEKVEMKLPQKTAGRRIETVKRMAEPELKGIRIDGKLAIIFSPYDVSCALEKINSLECKGYTPDSALSIGINVLLYAMEHL